MPNMMEFGQPIGVGVLASDPSSARAGEIYFNSTSDTFRMYTGTSWFSVPITSGVTSVALSAPGIFSVSGSPVTSTGTLSLSLATQSVNTIFAGPSSGLANTPTFRSLVAADIPLISLSSGITGTLGIANGGTGLTSTPSNGQVLIGNGSGYALSTLTAGTGISISNSSGSITINSTISSGANTALSNLASTAVNADIKPGSDNSINLGSASLRFSSAYAVNVNAGSSALNLNGSSINANSLNITNVATPVNGTDAANKSYVDATAFINALIFG